MSESPVSATRAAPRRPGRPLAATWAWEHRFAAGVLAISAVLGLFLLLVRTAWPPHEDEALALLVGKRSLGNVFHTVLHERGGAPLHFLIAWLVVHLGGGLDALRLASALFAVATIPVAYDLVRRLSEQQTALAAAALLAGTWVLLFHGVYARMYSLFLLTSALSYLALVIALRSVRRRDWALWGAASLAMVATHPYGALVTATQVLFVALGRNRSRQCLVAFAALGTLGSPFWYADLVLAHRFDVGVGGGGDTLGTPGSVVRYLGRVAGDFSSGWRPLTLGFLLLAAFGLVRLVRTRRPSALLAAVVLGLPAVALTLARLGHSTSPQSRHLIFALPFFSMLVASGLRDLARRFGGAPLTVAAVTLALVAEVGWAWHKTPELFTGDPAARANARESAAAWVAGDGRRDDVLFGYEPVYLLAWERSRMLAETVVPRADGKLALDALRSAPRPLGRGVFVLDAGDSTNLEPRTTIPLRLPQPATSFEGQAFGPYLVIRTRRPTRTAAGFLDAAARAMELGRSLRIGDAPVNLHAILDARRQLAAQSRGGPFSAASSRSASSR